MKSLLIQAFFFLGLLLFVCFFCKVFESPMPTHVDMLLLAIASDYILNKG